MELRIESLTAGGRGLARPGGPVWFVPGAFPGDRVAAVCERARERYVEGRMVSLVESAPDRRRPPCPIQGVCGGCPWMPLAETSQRMWKERLLREALTRIGGLDAGVVEGVRAGRLDLGYRGRVELTLGRSAGRPVVGMHAADPRGGLVDVERCRLPSDAAAAVIKSARQFLLAEGRLWPEASPDEPYRLAVRSSSSTRRVLVALWEGRVPFPEAGRLAAWIATRHAEVQGVARIRAAPGRRGGAEATALSGKPWLEERIGGLDFRIPATTFTQVNAEWSSELPRLVREVAQDVAGRWVVDLYGGIGVNGFELARAGAEGVLVCEADGAAVRCGRATARRARIDAVRFLRCSAERLVEARWPVEHDVRLVVANPPRAGMSRRVARGLAARGPERIVLVSCDPATLARDARILADRGGYRLARAVPVDLFPQTPHLESVALLVRRGSP